MQSTFSITVVESSAKCLEILQSYLEKSGNFTLPNLWEPCYMCTVTSRVIHNVALVLDMLSLVVQNVRFSGTDSSLMLVTAVITGHRGLYC